MYCPFLLFKITVIFTAMHLKGYAWELIIKWGVNQILRVLNYNKLKSC